jgi:two-component system CheB/CheR fusion protein
MKKRSATSRTRPRRLSGDSKTAAAQPGHYVAIGASAGGLEAIESFFTHMPGDSGLTFIVIQHLSPDYKSLMVELLSKKTPMAVQRAEDGMLAKPNTIYLIPPKKNLRIFHGKLLLGEQDHSRGINLPIDVFMRSLAEDQREKAVGIILSGTGSDGMRGVRAIKEHGGMVMVQNEESAKFDGMPKAAQSTGLTDFVLPPDQMPSQLLSFVKHPCVAMPERSEVLLSDEDRLAHLFSILRERCKIDFTYYKPSTVTRRIERRMTIHQVATLQEYVAFLQHHPAEVSSLYKELLIGVTSFFRDSEVWEKLAQGPLRELLSTDPEKPLRFWVPACSTGEEAYTLAILTRECLEALGLTRDVKIFATDIDQDAISFAAAGSYPESIAADVSGRLLSKYFFRREENFQVSRALREMVVFARHNLIKDPPFTKISLVSCRNVLIYLQPVLQRRVLDGFGFSIHQGGLLLLGTSETSGELPDHWETLDTKIKLYRSKLGGRPQRDPDIGPTDTRARDLRGRYSNIRKSLRSNDEERVLERFLESLTPDYIPLALVVNEQMELLHVFGDAEGFFKVPAGKLVNDVTRMARKELRIPLATGIQKAFHQGKELRFSNIRLSEGSAARTLDLLIRPLPLKRSQEPLVAVFLGETRRAQSPEGSPAVLSYDVSKEAENRIRDLEQDLQFTRENLQATVEELETSNEELQATNEELLASNEELQSTNEELQSTNEELYTVNTEFQSRILELTTLHHDVDNLFSASHIGTVLLDENLEVRRFSPLSTKIFRLLESDIGRPLPHVPHLLKGVDFTALLREAQARAEATDHEVQTSDGLWFLLRLAPYMVGPQSASGLVITILDISRRKSSEAALAVSEQRNLWLFESLAQGIVAQAADGRITLANPAAERILGLSLDQLMGRTSLDPAWKSMREDGSDLPGRDHPAMVSLRTGKPVSNFIMGVHKPGAPGPTWISTSSYPQLDEQTGRALSVVTSFEDISELMEADRRVRDSERRYRQLFDELPIGIGLAKIILDENGAPWDYRYLEINPAFERITGLRAADFLGRNFREVLPNLEEVWVLRFGQVAITGVPDEFEHYAQDLGRHYTVRAYQPMPGHFVVLAQEKLGNDSGSAGSAGEP